MNVTLRTAIYSSTRRNAVHVGLRRVSDHEVEIHGVGLLRCREEEIELTCGVTRVNLWCHKG